MRSSRIHSSGCSLVHSDLSYSPDRRSLPSSPVDKSKRQSPGHKVRSLHTRKSAHSSLRMSLSRSLLHIFLHRNQQGSGRPPSPGHRKLHFHSRTFPGICFHGNHRGNCVGMRFRRTLSGIDRSRLLCRTSHCSGRHIPSDSQPRISQGDILPRMRHPSSPDHRCMSHWPGYTILHFYRSKSADSFPQNSFWCRRVRSSFLFFQVHRHNRRSQDHRIHWDHSDTHGRTPYRISPEDTQCHRQPPRNPADNGTLLLWLRNGRHSYICIQAHSFDRNIHWHISADTCVRDSLERRYTPRSLGGSLDADRDTDKFCHNSSHMFLEHKFGHIRCL